MKNADSLWLSLIRSANRRTRNSQVLRRAGILAYRSFMQTIIFLPPPKVLLIGPPKSGTHLLRDCLSLMPRMMFSGRQFALTDFYDRSGESGNVSDSEAYLALRETDLRNFLKRNGPEACSRRRTPGFTRLSYASWRSLASSRFFCFETPETWSFQTSST